MTNEQQQEALDNLSERAREELFTRFLRRVEGTFDMDFNALLVELLLEVQRDFRS